MIPRSPFQNIKKKNCWIRLKLNSKTFNKNPRSDTERAPWYAEDLPKINKDLNIKNNTALCSETSCLKWSVKNKTNLKQISFIVSIYDLLSPFTLFSINLTKDKWSCKATRTSPPVCNVREFERLRFGSQYSRAHSTHHSTWFYFLILFRPTWFYFILLLPM